MKRLLALLLPLVSAVLQAQGTRVDVRSVTVADLPATCTAGRIYNVRDGASATDCTTGGGSTAVWCICDAGGSSYTGQDATPSGGGGSAVILDLADDASNESTDLSEIATTGDTNSIFTEPSADKLLIAVGQNWPTADAATALAANGANCAAGQWAAGVDASGAAEGCTADDDVPESGDFGAGVDLEADGSLSIDVVAAAEMADADHGDVSWTSGVATVDSGAVGVTELADDATCAANEVVARNAGDTAFECQTPSGGLGGSTGSTDNAILRADGTGGSTVQSSGASLDDNSMLTLSRDAADVGTGGNHEMLILDITDPGLDLTGNEGPRIEFNVPVDGGSAQGAEIRVIRNSATDTNQSARMYIYTHNGTDLTGAIEIDASQTVRSARSSSAWRMYPIEPTSSQPGYMPNGNDSNTGVGYVGADSFNLIAGGQEGVRIAESSSVVTVTIDDALELDPQSAAPVACAAGTAGTMYYDSDNGGPCFCNGTGYVQFDDWSTACS